MPKSKRNKIVHLTQVKKKGKDHKADLAKQLETYCAQFSKVYIFDIDQTKSDRLTLLRVRLKQHGRIFAGQRGLFFSNIVKDDLLKILSDELPEFCPKLLGYADIAPKCGIKNKDVQSVSESSSPNKNENQKMKVKYVKI